jgi:hypothetical protein
MRHSRHKKRKEAINMKLLALASLALFVSVPSFSAGGVVTNSAKPQLRNLMVATTDHAASAVVKHLF